MYSNIGLIGNPIKNSFSPVIHAEFLNRCELKGGYACFEETNGANLANLINMLRRYSFLGANVTVPYKVDIMSHCTTIDDSAAHAGAVNTIKFDKDKIIGYNTDIYGFSEMLKDENIDVRGKDVLVWGAGGAARAVVAYLNDSFPKSLTIANRTLEKSKKLAEFYRYPSQVTHIEDINGKEFDVVINAISLGLSGEVVPNYNIGCRIAAIDLQYKEKITPFLSFYKDSDIKVVNGIKMLIYQAHKSFQIWTGREFNPNVDKLLDMYYSGKYL